MNYRIDTTPVAAAGAPRFADRLPHAQGIAPDLAAAFVAHDGGANNLDRLLTGGGACITTGQQPGLFTGPLFTVYKALSAIVLARRAENELGRPVVPVFWVAGDDHDFAEANHFSVLAESEVERLELRTRDEASPSIPLYRETIGSDVDAVFDRLTAVIPQSEFREEVFEWLRRHYTPGRDMASAFGRAMAELLGRFGLVVFDPTHPAAKMVAGPWIVRALEQARPLAQALVDRASELAAAGQPTPVPAQGDHTLVMIDAELGRDRLTLDRERFVTRRSGEEWSLDDLRALADAEPTRLSANVLLRPVVEAAILPTLGYVAGPGELAYIPQAAPVYAGLAVTPQPYVARWSARVVEKRVRKTLDRYAITPEDLQGPEGQLEGRLVREGLPDSAAAALETLRTAVRTTFPELVETVGEIDPTLEKPARGTRGQIESSIDHLEKRIVAKLKQQDETLRRQIDTARAALFPHGVPQERVYNIVAFLAKYGWLFLDDLVEACETWAGEPEPVSGGT